MTLFDHKTKTQCSPRLVFVALTIKHNGQQSVKFSFMSKFARSRNSLTTYITKHVCLSLFQVLVGNSDQRQQMAVSYDKLLFHVFCFQKETEAAESYIDLHKWFLIIKNVICLSCSACLRGVESYTGCPTLYRTRNFFNNFTTNEDIATKFEADLPHYVRNVTVSYVLEVATICVQTGLNPARHILECPWQYVRCHCLNFFGDIYFQGVYGSWFVLVKTKQTTNKTKQTLSQITERSAERCFRQETGWLAGGPLFCVATFRRTTDTHYRHIPLHFSHNERTPVQISLQYLNWC